MGGFENIVKIEELRKKKNENDYLSAINILDAMNIKKIKNLSDLSLIAEVYSQNARYDEAKELLLTIYEKTQTRRALFQLVWVLIDSNNVTDAESYFTEYMKIAPDDFNNYIIRYKIDKIKGEPYDKLIDSLEQLKKYEYLEKWAYELAKLYYKAGMEEKCVGECSDIVLWFTDGVYVEKAKMLRSYFSGNKDKNSMIEELKRRAHKEKMTDYHSDQLNEDMQNQIIESNIGTDGLNTRHDNENINTEDRFHTLTENSNYDNNNHEGMDEKIDFGPKEDAEQFSASLKYEIENIMMVEKEEKDKDPEFLADLRLNELSTELGFDVSVIFGEVLKEEIKVQLVEKLDLLLGNTSQDLQLILAGTAVFDKTVLAKGIALILTKAGKLNSSKIAKINAEKLNKINILDKKETLQDCCMIIENAEKLKISSVNQIQELIRNLNGNIAVIYEKDSEQKFEMVIGHPFD